MLRCFQRQASFHACQNGYTHLAGRLYDLRPTIAKQHNNQNSRLLSRSAFQAIQGSSVPTKSLSDIGKHDMPDDTGTTVRISIKDENGKPIDTRMIKRSFPRAKPTKLIKEIEKLLSARLRPQQTRRDIYENESKSTIISDKQHASHSKQPPLYRSNWALTNGGNGVYTTLIVADGAFARFLDLVNHEADQLQHHPHVAKSKYGGGFVIDDAQGQNADRGMAGGNHDNDQQIESEKQDQSTAWLVHILNTTHNPAGLSMKDIRLANKIDEIITTLNSERTMRFRINDMHPFKSEEETVLQKSPSTSVESKLELLPSTYGVAIEYLTSWCEGHAIRCIIQSLEEQNIKAAEMALSNPNSICVTRSHSP